MKNNEHIELKEKLEQEMERTKNTITDYKDMIRPEGLDSAVGRVSRMDAINNRSVMEAALREAEEKLKKLNYVYSRLNEEDFGMCIRCGNPIPVGRIMLMPQSSHCVNCAR